MKELEFQKNWLHCAGKVAERKEVISIIEKKASEHFLKSNDLLAFELRGIANKLRVDGKKEEAKLDTFINKNRGE